MTIEEAIIHAEQVAKREEENAKQYDNAIINQRNEFDAELCRSGAKSCRKCAAEHRQLAFWLKELKAIKECLKDKCLTCEHCEKCREEYK